MYNLVITVYCLIAGFVSPLLQKLWQAPRGHPFSPVRCTHADSRMPHVGHIIPPKNSFMNRLAARTLRCNALVPGFPERSSLLAPIGQSVASQGRFTSPRLSGVKPPVRSLIPTIGSAGGGVKSSFPEGYLRPKRKNFLQGGLRIHLITAYGHDSNTPLAPDTFVLGDTAFLEIWLAASLPINRPGLNPYPSAQSRKPFILALWGRP